MTVYAQLIMEAIGRGRRLRVVKNSVHGATLVNNYADWRPPHVPRHLVSTAPVIGPLDASAVAELLELGVLTKLTEHQQDQRVGWRDIGLDGSKADFYVCIQ